MAKMKVTKLKEKTLTKKKVIYYVIESPERLVLAVFTTAKLAKTYKAKLSQKLEWFITPIQLNPEYNQD
jgi:hypothetical protein